MPGTSDNNEAGSMGTVNVGVDRPIGTKGSEACLNEEFPDGDRLQNGHGGPVITSKQQSQSNEINKAG